MINYQSIYNTEPDDLELFWTNYPYFCPDALFERGGKYRYQFIFLAEVNTDDAGFLEMINQYLNVKFNPVSGYKTFEQNLAKFSRLAAEASLILKNILKRAYFPEVIENLFRETQEVSETNDIRDMINVFNRNDSVKIKYEILRKIGLMVLLNRVKNTQSFQKSLKYNSFINRLFLEKLNLRQQRHVGGDYLKIFFWMNDTDVLAYSYDEHEAVKLYNADNEKRSYKGKTLHDLQYEIMFPQMTRAGNNVLKYISRLKNKHEDREDYTSVIEKIIRKNIRFPSEITDIHGVTFVVDSEEDTFSLIAELEEFLGGTNTRKNEKIIEKAGDSGIVDDSKENFRIWKTIYDITSPNEMLDAVNYGIRQAQKDIAFFESMLTSLENSTGRDNLLPAVNNHIADKLKDVKKFRKLKDVYESKPFDIYLEIQIQELKSYLLSKCYGSEIEHRLHKSRQVMSSSFYKLFPRKIYEPILLKQ
ncbi:MAG: hypothetical protein JXN64_13540 [Spirochaetes bacterium]|nr:hypothetical protein [Spirochaetota bacterium]